MRRFEVYGDTTQRHGIDLDYRDDGSFAWFHDVEPIIAENERLKARVAERDQLQAQLKNVHAEMLSRTKEHIVEAQAWIAQRKRLVAENERFKVRVAELEARSEYVAKAVQLMDAYREAKAAWQYTGMPLPLSLERLREALLKHAYNEGKAP